MTRSVIVAGARTPIGKFRGSLAGFTAMELGSIAIRAALERSGVAPEQVEYVIMGHVIQAGAGQITARQAAVGAGIPKEVPAITVNKVCLSGLSAIAMADQMIRAGELEIVVAGGMESMTNAPFLIPKARDGSRLGDTSHARLDDPRRPVVELPRPSHGRGHRYRQPRARHRSRRTGHVVGPLAPAGGRGVGGGTTRRGGRGGRGAAAEGRPGRRSIATKACGRTRASRRSPR